MSRPTLALRSAAALAATTAVAAAAAAQPLRSAYTDFDSRSCRHRAGTAEEDYGAWRCPGYRGLPVRLSAGDGRMFVSFGPASDPDLAGRETFPAFNDVYEGRVEWRLKSGRPVATILRWNVVTAADRETATGPVKASGRVLVVTRLGPGGTCHIGYVDARANPDANARARNLADERAESFRCGQDRAEVVGARTPGLAFPGDR